MAHAVSAFYIRSSHMSLLAALLAVALHAVMGMAAWSLAPLHTRDLEDNAIEITMEEPTKPEEPTEQVAMSLPPPPPPPAAPPQPQPVPQPTIASREQLGLPPEPPEADPVVEPTKPVAQAPERKPDPEPEAKPEPKPEPPAESKPPEPVLEPTPVPQQQAAVAPPPEPPPPPPAPEPALEQAVPPVETPPAPLTMRDFVKALPPPPPRPAPSPPRPAPQQQAPPALQHSPLSAAPSRQQQQQSGAAVSTFVNPAMDATQTRAKDAYLWQIVRKFSQYLPDLRDKNEGGTVVLRFVIARDGRLVDSSIVKSSGVTALDRGLLESLRAASPYPPLPAEIPGNQVTFTQPIAARR